MHRLLAVGTLALAVQCAMGQERIDEPPCKQLFVPRTTDAQSDAEKARITERWLVEWYPTRKHFEDARVKKIDEKTACLLRARAAVAALQHDREEFERKLEIYGSGPIPASARAYFEDVTARLAAAKEHELVQQRDLLRIQDMYDAQLRRLQSRPGWR